ncbi:MAG: class I SAM-dependent RNA methyltransferase [Chloroflexota bacterium]|nr:class I SAM-dependent RNA methyltransferase [Chloroflexota bacterium]
MSDDNLIELTLDRPAHGGYCIGRHDGKAILVRFGLPGERVRARITQDKKRFAFAETVEVLEASPHRVTPGCRYFGTCGGCHWQHAAYNETLAIKQAVVVEQFARVGGMPDAPILPTLPTSDHYGYRVHVTMHGTPNGALGFVSVDSRRAIPIEACPIARPDVNDALDVIARRGMLHAPGSRLRVQVGDVPPFVTARMVKPDDDEPDDDAVAQIYDNSESGTPFVTYRIGGRTFRCSAGAFFQVNLAGAAILIDEVLARLALTGSETVLDLYSGGGLFSAFLSEHAGAVIAVESAPLAVADAKVNLLDCPNVEMRVGRVEDMLTDLLVDAAVVDPPRAGMKPEALSALIAASPRRIAYVSCDPATLARDAKALVAAGYTLTDVQPVDMFPQTYHVECVAGFVRE